MHIEAQPRPNSRVEMREDTSIHEAGGDRQRGSEAIGARQGLGSAVSGGRRRKKKNGKGGEEQQVEMGKEEKEKINKIF